MVRKLPKRLKDLARNIDAGLDISGRLLSTTQRRATAGLLGAEFFRSQKGKIKRVRR